MCTHTPAHAHTPANINADTSNQIFAFAHSYNLSLCVPACFCQRPWLEYQLKVLIRQGDFQGAMLYETPWVDEETKEAIIQRFEPETYNRRVTGIAIFIHIHLPVRFSFIQERDRVMTWSKLLGQAMSNLWTRVSLLD